MLLSSYGNVPAERTANLLGMLLGVAVSPGFVDLASERLSSRLQDAGFDEAMQAALAEEPVLAADETPVNLTDPHAGLAEEDAGAPHVLVVRTPHAGLTWLRALGSRQHAPITAILLFFAGFLISDGYGAYGVEIMTADAGRTGLASGSFDLVHARTLLVNLPDPADVAAEMVRLARPGGWVASMEPDTEYGRCHPPHPAFDRLCDIFTVVFRRNGADPWIGRRVPELLRQAGLDDVQVEARVQMYPPGNSRRTIRPDLVRAMRPQVLDMGLASAAELEELDTAARAHLQDPHTVVISGLLFLAWGRKPGNIQ